MVCMACFWGARCGTRNRVSSEQDVSPWSSSDSLRLAPLRQAAYLVEEDPAQPGFWARVAGRVAGKSAANCFNRLYDAVPTPAPPQQAARRAAAAAAAAPLRPPALTAASGALQRP